MSAIGFEIDGDRALAAIGIEIGSRPVLPAFETRPHRIGAHVIRARGTFHPHDVGRQNQLASECKRVPLGHE